MAIQFFSHILINEFGMDRLVRYEVASKNDDVNENKEMMKMMMTTAPVMTMIMTRRDDHQDEKKQMNERCVYCYAVLFFVLFCFLSFCAVYVSVSGSCAMRNLCCN